MPWKESRAKNLAKQASGPALTEASVHLQFVVSGDGSEPWGIGFANGIVNSKTKAAVAKLRSAADNWTWILQWYSDLKIWASLKIPGDRGFCTLEDFLQTDDVLQLWNNASLVASWTFVKDKVDGEILTEEEAIDLARQFPCDDSPDPPVTPVAGSKRRVFQGSPAASSGQGSSTKARRRCAVPVEYPPGPVLLDPRRRPCKAEKRELTLFAFVCNAAECNERLKINGKAYRGWFVRFRVSNDQMQSATNLLCKCDAKYGLEREGPRRHRIFWKADRHEAWIKVRNAEHGVDFVNKLLLDKKISDHNIS